MTSILLAPPPVAGPSRLGSLPFTLDLSCPLNLPSKSLNGGTGWPYPTAGPSTALQESSEVFVRRRYYEALYLSEADDQQSSRPSPVFADSIKWLLLSLPKIELRHRKIILPILTSSQSAESAEHMSAIEISVIKLALDLRTGSRQAVDEGIIPSPKKISDELEKRETLIQIILLLLYITHAPPSQAEASKKRKRSKSSRRNFDADSNDAAAAAIDPIEDPKTALELLVDRLSVWQAVSELGLALGDPAQDKRVKGKSKAEENPIANMLGKFWKSVILPFFMSKQPDFCSLFHQKVFGHPIPPKLLPTSLPGGPHSHSQNHNQNQSQNQTKKPRKPKLTHPILSKSSDSLLPPPPIPRDRPRSVSGDSVSSNRRPISRAGSEVSSFSRNSPPRDEGSLSMRRSLSRTSTTNDAISAFRRSRSKSIDPNPNSNPNPNLNAFSNSSLTVSKNDKFSRSASSTLGLSGNGKKSLTRNQSSGRDLFKGREVGLIRRTASRKLEREDSLSQSQHQLQNGRSGLLGRKTSGGGNGKETVRRGSMDESQKQHTLILATPSKPRHQPQSQSQSQFQSQSQSQSQFFRPSQSLSWIPPTPIREEPSSAPRPTYVAETPMTTRIAHTDVLPLGGLAVHGSDEDQGMDSDDPLGELWELTDEEGDDDGAGAGAGARNGRNMVPETPVK
uniref:DNA replication regulator Sld3 C-terminal domain-containing protein n=1 Tax=Kwoniella dejecticola CBS 10117 TaxID=1296121 RepID=A0A1A5ZW81_9TREE|nr:uncharacterized protein I303_07971 [Kwoniella dejecticola CBS 10117]OBR82057.1 hypothetical protein I303_07971 [Kwoniella dejecticola CBS 10117]